MLRNCRASGGARARAGRAGSPGGGGTIVRRPGRIRTNLLAVFPGPRGRQDGDRRCASEGSAATPARRKRSPAPLQRARSRQGISQVRWSAVRQQARRGQARNAASKARRHRSLQNRCARPPSRRGAKGRLHHRQVAVMARRRCHAAHGQAPTAARRTEMRTLGCDLTRRSASRTRSGRHAVRSRRAPLPTTVARS